MERMTAATYREKFVNLPKKNKYNAKPTIGPTSDGGERRFDSGFEARVSNDLYMRQLAGEFLSYETQYKIEIVAYTKDGEPAITKSHKVDFMVNHHDGTKELVEAKGLELGQYREVKKWITHLFLPSNPDYSYTVLKERGGKRQWR